MWLLCPAIFHVSVFIFFLGGIFRQFGGIFYNVSHKLLEVKRILFCDNGLAGFRFKSLPCNAGHLAAAVKAEEKAPKAKKSRTAKPKKPSIRAQLDAAKKEQSKQTLPREKAKELEV